MGVKTTWEVCLFQVGPFVRLRRLQIGIYGSWRERDWSRNSCYGNSIKGVIFFFSDAHLWCQVWRTLLQYIILRPIGRRSIIESDYFAADCPVTLLQCLLTCRVCIPGLWSTSNAPEPLYLFLSHGPMSDVQVIREIMALSASSCSA